MQDQLIEFVKLGHFFKAYEIICSDENINIYDLCVELGCVENNICGYAFICYLISADNDFYYHYLARFILFIGFCYIKGAYHGVYHHQCSYLALDLNDLEQYEHLLSLHYEPELIIENAEAYALAEIILNKDPDNKSAKKTLLKKLNYKKNKIVFGQNYLIELQQISSNNFVELIKTGRLIAAKNLIKSFDIKIIHDVCIKIARDKNICAYTFVWFLMEEKEMAWCHELLADIAYFAFYLMNGCRQVQFFHLRRASMLAPDTIEIQEKLLNLYEPGNESFDVEETKKRAQKVLELKPKSEPALRVLRLLDDLG